MALSKAQLDFFIDHFAMHLNPIMESLHDDPNRLRELVRLSIKKELDERSIVNIGSLVIKMDAEKLKSLVTDLKELHQQIHIFTKKNLHYPSPLEQLARQGSTISESQYYETIPLIIDIMIENFIQYGKDTVSLKIELQTKVEVLTKQTRLNESLTSKLSTAEKKILALGREKSTLRGEAKVQEESYSLLEWKLAKSEAERIRQLGELQIYSPVAKSNLQQNIPAAPAKEATLSSSSVKCYRDMFRNQKRAIQIRSEKLLSLLLCSPVDKSTVLKLIEDGIDPSYYTAQEKHSLLQLCVIRGLHNVLLVLLSMNPKINHRDACNNTVAHTLLLARLPVEKKYDLLTTLIEHNVDLNLENTEGVLPLHLAAGTEVSIFLEVVKHSSPGSINVLDAGGNSPIHYAIKNGNQGCVFELMQRGADLNIANNASENPIQLIQQQWPTLATRWKLNQSPTEHLAVYPLTLPLPAAALPPPTTTSSPTYTSACKKVGSCINI